MKINAQDQPITWTSLVNTATTNTNGDLKKTLGGSTTWNADAISDKNLIGDGSVTFSAKLASYVAVGFGVANFDRTYTTMPYVIRLTSSNTAAVYEENVSKFALGSYTASTVFSIRRTGTLIEYLKDGVVQYTSTVPSTGEMVVDTSFYTVNSELLSTYLASDDRDNDHMADAWELQYITLPPSPTAQDILDALTAFSPNDDTLDSDGCSNFQEYQDGTDPTQGGDGLYSMFWLDLVNLEEVDYYIANIKKISGGTAWNADAVSSFAGDPWSHYKSEFKVTFSAATGSYLALGISTKNADRTYTGFTHSIRLTSSNTAAVFESGTSKFDLGSYSPQTVFGIERDGDVIKYSKDNVILYTSLVPSRTYVLIDTSFYTVNSEILWCRSGGGDLDQDGLPDKWELQQLPAGSGLPELVDFDYYDDADGDGVSNGQEYYDKTNPTNKDDFVDAAAWHSIGLYIPGGYSGYYGSYASKGGAAAGWLSLRNTKDMIGDGNIISAFLDGSDAAIGLGNEYISFTSSYTILTHAIRVTTAGTAAVFENGTSKFNLGAYDGSTLFSLRRTGNVVSYYKDGYLMYTSTLPSVGKALIIGVMNTEATGMFTRINNGDMDSDQMADAWEFSHLPPGSTMADVTAFTSEGDADGDGVFNGQEFLDQTDPNDPFSAFEAIHWKDFVNTDPLLDPDPMYQYFFGQLKKTAGGTTAAWNADAVSTKRLMGDGGISVSAPGGTYATTYATIGLDASNPNRTYTGMDYSIRFNSSDVAAVYEAGTLKYTIGNYYHYNTFSIHRKGTVVRYYKDNVLVYTSTVPSIGDLLVDTSFYSLNSEFYTARIGTGDVDNDGMADAWELTQLDLPPATSVADQKAAVESFLPEGQSDEDGVANLHEFLDSTDPFEPWSHLQPVTWVSPALVNAQALSIPDPLNPSTTINNGGIKKDTGAAGYNAGSFGDRPLIGDGWLAFRGVSGGELAIGLNYAQTNNSYTDLDYGIICRATGLAEIYENNVNVADIGEYGPYTRFVIVREGSQVRYFKDGVLVYTSATPSKGLMIVDCALSTLNAQVETVRVNTGDLDNDGMADAWEFTQMLPLPEGSTSTDAMTALNGFEATGDADSDGVSNLYEYQDRTLANDASSYLTPVTWQFGVNTLALNDSGGINNGGLKKSAGANNAYNAGAVSTRKIVGDGRLSISGVTGGQLFFGLNYENPGQTYTDIEYAILCRSTGIADIYENGTQIAGVSLGVYSYNTRFAIERTGTTVKYYKDGVEYYTSVTPSTGEIMADTSYYTLNAEINEARLSTGDIDDDHMPDSWEFQALPEVDGAPWADRLAALEDFEAGDDKDGDTITNLQEYRDGTEANNNFSFLKPVVWTQLTTNVSIGGSTTGGLQRTGGTAAYNAGAISTISLASDAHLSFRLNALAQIAVGFNSGTNTTATMAELDYAILTKTTGLAEIYENGLLTGVASSLGAYTNQTVFAIRRIGNEVKYYKDNVCFRTTVIGAGTLPSLYVDCSIYTSTGVIAETRLSSDDADGDGMKDLWETLKLNTTDFSQVIAFKPDDDADGDGYTNLEEFLALTEPFNNQDPAPPVDGLQPVVWQGHRNTVSINTVGGLYRPADVASGLNADAVSTLPLAVDGTLKFKVTYKAGVDVYVGLSDSALATYADLDFAFKAAGDGSVQIYHDGTPQLITPAAYTSSTVFEITRSSAGVITYKLNGAAVSGAPTPTRTTPLFVDNSLVTSDGLIRQARYKPGMIGDSDGDWMLDSWEIAQFGDLSHDGTADTDGDGITDREEFELGLDPHENDFTAATPAGNNRETITFDNYGHLNTVNGANSATYTIDADSNLTGKN